MEHLPMERAEAIRIVGALADGQHPFSGQPLSSDDICQHPQVVRALCEVVHHLRDDKRIDHPEKLALENAGKPWTPDEEAQLVRAFDAGTDIAQLALQHKRTHQAIHGRLYRLGKMPAW